MSTHDPRCSGVIPEHWLRRPLTRLERSAEAKSTLLLEVRVRCEAAGGVGGGRESARSGLDEYDGRFGWCDQPDQAPSCIRTEVAAALGCLNQCRVGLRCPPLRRPSSARVHSRVPTLRASGRSTRLRWRPAGRDADPGNGGRALLRAGPAAYEPKADHSQGNENKPTLHACHSYVTEGPAVREHSGALAQPSGCRARSGDRTWPGARHDLG